jgi:hypothetical protein
MSELPRGGGTRSNGFIAADRNALGAQTMPGAFNSVGAGFAHALHIASLGLEPPVLASREGLHPGVMLEEVETHVSPSAGVVPSNSPSGERLYPGVMLHELATRITPIMGVEQDGAPSTIATAGTHWDTSSLRSSG